MKAKVTATIPALYFVAFDITGATGKSFIEKSKGDSSLINYCFFIIYPELIEYICGDQTVRELEPLERLALEGDLAAYQRKGFWQPMDTLRGKNLPEELWAIWKALSKVWK